MNDFASNISLLKKLLDEEIYDRSGKRNNDEKIIQIIAKLNNYIKSSYDVQRQHISTLLTVYEERLEHILPILSFLFISKLENSKNLHIKHLNIEFFEDEFDLEMIASKYFPFFENTLKVSNLEAYRISDNINITIEEDDGLMYLRFLNVLITSQSVNFELNLSDVNTIMLNLMVARNICNQIKRTELFYFLVVIFFDALFINEKYQLARDIAEECLICSYNDKIEELGYFLSYIVFARTSNSSTALHYGIISLTILQSKGSIYNRLIKNFYYESIKLMRNIGFVEFAARLYNEKPTNVDYDDYEKNKFAHGYFSAILLTLEKQLPSKVLEFLDRYKETVILQGKYEAVPWISILLNIRKNYQIEAYDDNHLNQYLSVFRLIVGEETYHHLHDKLFGNADQLRYNLRKALVRLIETRNESDFVTDNKNAIQFSKINILESHLNSSVEGYLLSMILQSDYSVVFKEKDANLLEPIAKSFEEKTFDKSYIDPKILISEITLLKDVNILWLGSDRHRLLPLYFSNSEFKFIFQCTLTVASLKKLIENTIDTLPLEQYTIQKYPKEKSDYLNEEKDLKDQLSNLDLPLNPNKILLIVKDIDLSSFPHNLTKNNEGFRQYPPKCVNEKFVINSISTSLQR